MALLRWPFLSWTPRIREKSRFVFKYTKMGESEIFGRYRELWAERYGVPCALILSPLDYGKLGTHLHDFGVTHKQMMQALEGFFATDNPLVLKRKHPLGLFLVNPMQYVPDEPVRRYQASCPHQPICPNMLSCCAKQDVERGRL